MLEVDYQIQVLPEASDHHVRCRQTAEHWDKMGAQHSYSPQCTLAMEEHDKATKSATQAFAKLNGWKVARTHFDPYELLALGDVRRGRYNCHYGAGSTRGLDHPQYFKSGRRPVAIVVHNYAGGPGEPEPIPGLRVIELPWSWYYPGHTRAFCLLRED